MTYHIVTTLVMMKIWTYGMSRGPTSWPSANMKFVSQGRSAVSVANLRRNSTLRNTIHNPDVTGCIDLFRWQWQLYWVMQHAPCPMQHAQGFPWGHWTLLPGECVRLIAQVATMIINVACGSMAYKTQLLVYLLHRKPSVFLQWNEKEWRGWYWQRMFNIQCEDLIMLRFSNTKSSMLYNFLLSAGIT